MGSCMCAEDKSRHSNPRQLTTRTSLEKRVETRRGSNISNIRRILTKKKK